MNPLKLILFSVLASMFSAPPAFRTANAAADVAGDISDIQTRLASLEEENAALKRQVAGAPAPAADPLRLGGLQLPKGIEPKDVQWRVEAGLSVKHAVQAALAQLRLNGSKKKAVAAK